LVALAAAVGIAVWMSRQVTIPLKEMQTLSTAAAAGDLTGRATVRSNDEFAVVAGAFNTMLDSLAAVMSTMADSATGLSAATEELTLSSAQIAASADETATQATVAAAAADHASGNIQTVAAGSEQMGASITEISHNANEAVRVVAQAVTAVQDTGSTVTRLGESSREIGAFVKVITSIAEQTNLLALNATIEAARAGDAGKGFAVVAGEVKDLAQETAQATVDIIHRVESIQTDTAEAVAAIAGIATLISTINDFQMTIASAVEEQTATTAEMNRNVTGAATNSAEIALNITAIAQAAATTTEGVAQTLTASADLSRMSSELTSVLSHFVSSQRNGIDQGSGSSVAAQLTKAIGAHGTWKKRLTSAIAAGTHSEDPTIVAMDDRCDFGRWLHGFPPAAGAQAYHQASMKLHADFHREAANTLRLVSGGQQDHARASIAAGGSFTEASKHLTKTMMEWRQSAT
jgi:methyl-accepting chemotaxis protein